MTVYCSTSHKLSATHHAGGLKWFEADRLVDKYNNFELLQWTIDCLGSKLGLNENSKLEFIVCVKNKHEKITTEGLFMQFFLSVYSLRRVSFVYIPDNN